MFYSADNSKYTYDYIICSNNIICQLGEVMSSQRQSGDVQCYTLSVWDSGQTSVSFQFHFLQFCVMKVQI